MKRRTFVQLSCGGGETSARKRCHGELVCSSRVSDSLTYSKPVKLPKGVHLKIEGAAPIEDMPWCFNAQVVSSRFQSILERECPGDVEFHQVAVKRSRSVRTENPMYVLNWLRLVDCIDFKKSVWLQEPPFSPGDEPTYEFTTTVLDADRVPPSVRAFRLKHIEAMVLVDSSLKEAIRAAKLTGVQFYPLA